MEQLIHNLKKHFVTKDKKKIQHSHVNTENVKDITAIFYSRLILKMDFKKEEQKNCIKKLILSVIIPFLSVIIELPGNACWNFFSILSFVLKHEVKVLTEQELEDLFLRLRYCRAGLSSSIKVPFSEKIKIEIKKSGDQSLQDSHISDFCYLMKKLSKSKDCDGIYNHSRRIVYFYFLKLMSLKDLDSIIDSDLSWLVNDLWPHRIEALFAEKQIIQGSKECFGNLCLHEKNLAEFASNANVDELTVVWTDGYKQELFVDPTYQDKSTGIEPRENFLNILVALVVEKKKISEQWENL